VNPSSPDLAQPSDGSQCLPPPFAPFPVTTEIVESIQDGLTLLSPASGRSLRRILFVNSYGGTDGWTKIKAGLLPPHHLWGCLELVRMGYEVALAEPLQDFYLHRNPFPHDLRFLKRVRSWLGPEGIVYCGHNVLYWLPFLRAIGALRTQVVSLLFAREPLNLARGHSGIIALTPAAAKQAKKLAPKVKVAHLGWGADLAVFPQLAYNPQTFLSCGIANRDFQTLSRASTLCSHPIHVISSGPALALEWPKNVRLTDSGPGWNSDHKKVSFQELLYNHYAVNAASLIILKRDDREYTANGFTNLIEAMAMGRPVIVTRTGALPTEIDVEEVGCGLHIPPNDASALAAAIQALARDPEKAREMGENGRRRCESYYNIQRYGGQLHDFFNTL
jgi:hypothetical protein